MSIYQGDAGDSRQYAGTPDSAESASAGSSAPNEYEVDPFNPHVCGGDDLPPLDLDPSHSALTDQRQTTMGPPSSGTPWSPDEYPMSEQSKELTHEDPVDPDGYRPIVESDPNLDVAE